MKPLNSTNIIKTDAHENVSIFTSSLRQRNNDGTRSVIKNTCFHSFIENERENFKNVISQTYFMSRVNDPHTK